MLLERIANNTAADGRCEWKRGMRTAVEVICKGEVGCCGQCERKWHGCLSSVLMSLAPRLLCGQSFKLHSSYGPCLAFNSGCLYKFSNRLSLPHTAIDQSTQLLWNGVRHKMLLREYTGDSDGGGARGGLSAVSVSREPDATLWCKQ